VVGLGNPGAEYARTRHNIGFIVVEELARRWHLDDWTKKRGARLALERTRRIGLVEPLEYMNESGPPTLGIATTYKVPPPRILVVVDDLDLPFGRLRMRVNGSSGGHNGLKSLIAVFGTEFPRLRVGIGRDRESGEAIRHVLGAFSADETAALPAIVDRCIDGIETWVRDGPVVAQNRVNTASAS
jgi:PTH1 family peptidyl-tRNA hydrolase